MPPQILQTDRRLRSVPLITLHLTERCNSRCVSCDYWRHGREDMTLDSVSRLLPSLRDLGTRAVLISGGEPLIHPQWAQISQLLREQGLQLWLLTSGLVAGQACSASRASCSSRSPCRWMESIVECTPRYADSMHSTTVCAGIRAAVRAGASVSVRVTVQRANYSALPAFVTLTHELGAQQVSFLAADVRNPHAFGRTDGFNADIALQASDLLAFEEILSIMEQEHARGFSLRVHRRESAQSCVACSSTTARSAGWAHSRRNAAMRRSFPR